MRRIGLFSDKLYGDDSEPLWDVGNPCHDSRMTRYAIDAGIALRLIRDGSDADRRHQLVAPSVLRSQALSLLYRDVRAGTIAEPAGRSSSRRWRR